MSLPGHGVVQPGYKRDGLMANPVVAVALSGGIDSLAAGFLVRQQFKQVFGIHFTTGYETNSLDIAMLEAMLGFPVYSVDLSQAFETRVVNYFVSAYMAGKTPNPCLVCNERIKFSALLDHAEQRGADALATGHYASVINAINDNTMDQKQAWLERGADLKKDQSYFLSMVNPQILDRVIFPLAFLTKSHVRSLCKTHKLTPVLTDESQDICFLPSGKHGIFIEEKTGRKPASGPVVDGKGNKIGTHQGLHSFTVGQRKGINIPGTEPYYVKKIDLTTNTLHVCCKHELAVKQMMVEQLIWNFPEHENIDKLTVQIRYRHAAAKADIERIGNQMRVTFDTPQHAVTPGQAAVFYQGNRVLGAGIIA